MISAAHVITGTEVGGAEMMLAKVVDGLSRHGVDSVVISLRGIGPIGEELRARGVEVIGLELPRDVTRLATELRRAQPNIVQTWLYKADLIGGVVARASLRDVPIVWNLQNGDLDRRRSKRSSWYAAKSCARLSRSVPARIICCAGATAEFHAGLGYERAKMVVIPNGIDTKVFGPSPRSRDDVRAEFGLGADELVVGMFARSDPQKDHGTFIAAAERVARTANVHFILAGGGVDEGNQHLIQERRRYGLEGRLHLLGRRSDMPRLAAALDVGVLSSAFGEGLPNAIGEIMASGVPCVVTDVGDCRVLVGETGSVVARSDPDGLASAVLELLALAPDDRAALGARARAQVEARYSLDDVTGRYAALYKRLARL